MGLQQISMLVTVKTNILVSLTVFFQRYQQNQTVWIN